MKFKVSSWHLQGFISPAIFIASIVNRVGPLEQQASNVQKPLATLNLQTLKPSNPQTLKQYGVHRVKIPGIDSERDDLTRQVWLLRQIESNPISSNKTYYLIL